MNLFFLHYVKYCDHTAANQNTFHVAHARIVGKLCSVLAVLIIERD